MEPNHSTSDASVRSVQDKTALDVEVMVRAHEKWVAAGRPKGNGDQFWIAAREEIDQECRG
jgi:hypothetical protein